MASSSTAYERIVLYEEHITYVGTRGPISNTRIQIIEKTHPKNDLGVPILLYKPPQRGRPYPVTLYEDQWHEVLAEDDNSTRLYLGAP